jgi:hypothetical protein
MTQKKIFLKNINMGIKKTQNFANSLMPAFRNAPKKSLSQKTMRILSIFVYVHFLWFFAFNFC